jgi:hypothetical protein
LKIDSILSKRPKFAEINTKAEKVKLNYTMKLTRVAPVKGSKCAKKASHTLNFASIGGAQFI